MRSRVGRGDESAIFGQLLEEPKEWYAACDWLEEQGRLVECAGLRWMANHWREPARVRRSDGDAWEWYEWFPGARPSPQSPFGGSWLPVKVFALLREGKLDKLHREYKVPMYRSYSERAGAILDGARAAGVVGGKGIVFE